VQAGTAGVDRLLTGLAGRDVLLTNASGAHGVPMAELVLGMMLSFAAGLHTAIRAPADYHAPRGQILREKFELEGQSLCVLGLGDIGGMLARKAQALGMRVIGVRRGTDPFPYVDAQVTTDRLLDVLPQADHLALCLPLTSETVGIVGAAELAVMKPSAYIYNVGRGSSIDPDALIEALQAGRIAGAGLDVTDPEPLPVDSPLWAMPNVVLSRHTSGSSPFNADRITARACAPLDRLFGWGERHGRAATWLLLKGQSAADEVAAARATFNFSAELIPSRTDERARIVVARDVRRSRR